MTRKDYEQRERLHKQMLERLAKRRALLPAEVLSAFDNGRVIDVFFRDVDNVRFFLAEERRSNQTYSYELAGDILYYGCSICHEGGYPQECRLTREQAYALAALLNGDRY